MTRVTGSTVGQGSVDDVRSTDNAPQPVGSDRSAPKKTEGDRYVGCQPDGIKRTGAFDLKPFVLSIRYLNGDKSIQTAGLETSITEVVEGVCGFAPRRLRPLAVRVLVGEGLESRFVNEIHLSLHPPVEKLEELPRRTIDSTRQNTLAHEMGHLILAQELGSTNKLLKQYYSIHEVLTKTKIRLFDVFKEMGGCATTTEIDSFEGRVTGLNRDISNGLIKMAGIEDQLSINRDAWLALEELFADLVAVLFARDLDAIQKDAGRHPDQIQKDRAKYRSFSREWDLTKTDWKVYDYHDMLAPARGYIGKHIIPNTSAEKTIEIVLSVIRQILKTAPTTKSDWNPGRFNQGVINLLAEARNPG